MPVLDGKDDVQILIKIKGDDKELDDVDRKFQGFSNKTVKASQAVAAGVLAAGSAIASFIGVSVKAAIEYESAFAGVRKTVDATEAEFGQLSDNFRDLATRIPTSASELAEIGEIAGQLGVKGVDNITKFTETIARIADSTNLTKEQAATDFARIINIMGTSVDEVDRMGSAVVALGNNFAVNEVEISNFSQRIAGAGRLIGLTTDEVLAIGAAFPSVGIEAEAGGTAVQKVLLSMKQAASGASSEIIDNTKAIGDNEAKLKKLTGQLAVAEQKQREWTDKTKESTKMQQQQKLDELRQQIAGVSGELGVLNETNGQAAVSAGGFAKVLGITNQEFKDLVKNDPGEAFNRFVEGLAQIEEEGGDAASMLDELDLKDQRLIRSFLSLANAGGLLRETFELSSQATQENTALMEESEKRYETVAAQLDIVQNNFNEIALRVGEVFLPIIVEATQYIKDTLIPTIESMWKWLNDNQAIVMGVAAAIGTLMIPALWSLGVTLFTVTIPAIIATITAMLPIILFAAAVGLAVYAFAKAWESNFLNIRGITESVVNFVIGKINSLIDKLNFLIKVANKVSEMLNLDFRIGEIGKIGAVSFDKTVGQPNFTPANFTPASFQPANASFSPVSGGGQNASLNIQNFNNYNETDVNALMSKMNYGLGG